MSFAEGDRVVALVDVPLYQTTRTATTRGSARVMGVAKGSKGARGIVKNVWSTDGEGRRLIDVRFPQWPDSVGRFHPHELEAESIVDQLASLA